MSEHESDRASNESAPDAPASCGGCGGGKAEGKTGGNRRGFLFAAGTTLMTIGGVLVAAPIIGAAIAPARNADPDTWIPLAPASGFTVGATVLLKFKKVVSAPDDGMTSATACYVRCVEAGKFQVFAVNCAHLGCPVEWFEQSRLFMCPCHGGAYYEDGSRASGPPPRGLFEYQWRITNGTLEILAGRLPGLQEGT